MDPFALLWTLPPPHLALLILLLLPGWGFYTYPLCRPLDRLASRRSPASQHLWRQLTLQLWCLGTMALVVGVNSILTECLPDGEFDYALGPLIDITQLVGIFGWRSIWARRSPQVRVFRRAMRRETRDGLEPRRQWILQDLLLTGPLYRCSLALLGGGAAPPARFTLALLGYAGYLFCCYGLALWAAGDVLRFENGLCQGWLRSGYLVLLMALSLNLPLFLLGWLLWRHRRRKAVEASTT